MAAGAGRGSEGGRQSEAVRRPCSLVAAMFDTYRYKTGSGAAAAAAAAAQSCSGGTSAPSLSPSSVRRSGSPPAEHAMMFEFSPAIQISDKPFEKERGVPGRRREGDHTAY